MGRPSDDPAAWVDEHGEYLYNFAFSAVRNSSAAQDIVQETFLAALRAHGSFTGRSSLRTWLTGIMKHKIADHLRKKYRDHPAEPDRLPFEREDLFVEEGDWAGHWNPATGPRPLSVDPSDEADRRELHHIIMDCLDRLPPRMRSVFSLREVSELAADVVCKELGITATNLWVTLHRARMQIRLCVERSWNGTHP